MESATFLDFKNKLLGIDQSLEHVFTIINDSESNNFFIAGGIVRDFFVNGSSFTKDIDLFISDYAYEILTPLIEKNGNLIKNQFGNLRWYPSHTKSIYYDIIQISNFYNGLWKCLDITDVLNQFDYTANALAFDLKNGDFYNPLNGLRDAIKKELRAVRFDFPDIPVSSNIPISRNSVLWFRYNYYAKKLGYNIEPITQSWIDQNAYRMNDKTVFSNFFFNPDS